MKWRWVWVFAMLFLWSRGLSAIPLLSMAVIVWAIMQGHGEKAKMWADRVTRFKEHPFVVIRLKGDARAVWNMVALPFRLRKERGHFDAL